MTAAALDFNITAELRGEIRKWRTRAAVAGAAGAVALAVGFFVSPFQFYRSYLWSYVFLVGVAVGCLAWLMLQYLTGGAWGVVIRRPSEAAVRTLPLVALMFVPVLVGIPNLYQWSHANVVAADEVIRHKHVYLNTPFFIIRAAAFFAGWMFLGWYFNRWSEREDREGGLLPHRKMARMAGPGLVFWGFSVTFMAVDWVLSLDPHWFSTIFGMLFMAGQGLTGMAFLIMLLVLLSHRRPMSDVLTPRHIHDLGKLLLAMVMVWAYFSFSQFLIIWSGNLTNEIPWYLERMKGGWQFVALGLLLFHFALPFALLLSRDIKRNFKLLSAVAVSILLMRYVDLYWLVVPDFKQGVLAVNWMDLAAPLATGGLWLAYFLTQLEKRPLMPLHDPQLKEALEHGR